MKTWHSITMATLLALATTGLVSSASAQDLGGTEATQPLMDTGNNGAHATTPADSTGGTPDGKAQTGKPRTAGRRSEPTFPDCVGPASFCNVYFGS
jgi:Spy/CpxP family protein refolding chaperone